MITHNEIFHTDYLIDTHIGFDHGNIVLLAYFINSILK